MSLIRIGSFELRPADRQLCAAGKPVDIGARAFDLLLVLAESPGRLVTKATLIERVWPHLVVDENNLPAQVAALRRVLGAAAIRTVPRFGYRLDLPVSHADTDVMPDPQPAPVRQRREQGDSADPLVGRSADVEALMVALDRTRSVTLVGAAGVGKSRLAREIALRTSDDGATAVVVPLEGLDAVNQVPSAIALALELKLPDDTHPFQALNRALQGGRCLIVLDGAEHLANALASPLAALVDAAPRLTLLVTSQSPLGRVGEAVHRLEPLPMADAVELFNRRASQADHRFELAAGQVALAGEICRRLDGNPLAIELAAARVPSFGLAGLLANLDDRFRLLKIEGAKAGARHGVLQAAFDWSYGLLTQSEQRVFDGLGAFASSFTLAAGASAASFDAIDLPGAIDLIGRLVDRSLVTRLPGDPARYAQLETARSYARSRLSATGSYEGAERRMAFAMLRVINHAYEDYWWLDEAVWLQRHQPEIENVRAALAWARRHEPALAIALHGSAWPLFVEADLQQEARAAHDEAVALLNEFMPRAHVARFWQAVAVLDSGRQADRARYAAELAAPMHAAAGDLRSQYFDLLQAALNGRDEPEAAARTFAAARHIEQSDWPTRLLAHGAIVEGALLTGTGRFAEARAAYQRALRHAVATSERQALAATTNIVELDIAAGALDSALQLARPLAISLQHAGRAETRFELLSLLFGALLLAGDQDEARTTGSEILEVAGRLDTGRLYEVLDAMALLAARDGRHSQAARVAVRADAALARHGRERRGPAEDRIRLAVNEILDRALGKDWRQPDAREPAIQDELETCRLALGLRE